MYIRWNVCGSSVDQRNDQGIFRKQIQKRAGNEVRIRDDVMLLAKVSARTDSFSSQAFSGRHNARSPEHKGSKNTSSDLQAEAR